MAQFLQSYARMLQHVQTATSGFAHIDPVDRVDHSQDALVSGESLAAAGTTVLKRVRVGIRALLRHPEHGVASGRGGPWCAKKERAEEVLAELERDIENVAAVHGSKVLLTGPPPVNLHPSSCPIRLPSTKE
ncbi:unnamed protein product [Closterium sp. NIES-64]|nr:unnamed protein product [Closterium sp. NIES-64]